MKTYNKIIAVAMAGAICGSTAFSSISLAATKSSEKEEVIYANLTSSGDIEKIYAVNIFEDKDIVDYGVYETVKNMNTMDKINYSNGKITIQNSEDKLYYQGVMKQNTQMPWTIKVRYKLDGVEYAPSELAGKSGKLEISISIKENKKCKKNFFENYALQTVVQLDTNLCENIKSDEATMANVGGLKQLTYTILPGNEKDIKITTDVTDFEMSEIQVNGINLNLGLDKDSIDTSSLTGELDKLKDAVNDLDDGANELNDGAKKLDDGAVTLTDGIKTIQEGLDQLNSKSSSLTSGSSDVLSALKTIQSSLNNVSTSSKDLKQLSSASTSIKSGIDSLVKGLKTVDSSIDTYNSSLKKAGLNSASELAQKNNCKIIFDGSVSDEISVSNLCTILSNALDNSIEACSKIDSDETQIIDVKCVASELIQIIRISNPNLDNNAVTETSKADRKNHGFGLSNIRRTVERMDGQMIISSQYPTFVLEIEFKVK